MTDPLDDLQRVFERTTPAPDAARREANLARAQELFDQPQGSAAGSRRTDTRTGIRAGLEQGVRHMLNALISRPVLAAVGVVAAVGLAALFLIADRQPAPRPDAVVADAGAASESAEVSRSDRNGPGPAGREAGLPLGEPDESGAGRDPAGPAAAAPSPPDADELPSPSPARGAAEGAPSDVVLAASSPESPLPIRDEPKTSAAPDSSAAAAAPDSSLAVAAAELASQAERPGSRQGSTGRAGRVPVAEAAPQAEGARFLAPLRARLQGTAESTSAQPESLVSPVLVEGADYRALEATGRAGYLPAPQAARPSGTETFANEAASPLLRASEEPVSTFSVDVDTASYSVVRSSLTHGYLPAPESVRIEELVNYFPYAYPPPGDRGAPFRPTVAVSETPWNADTLLMHIGIQGRLPATEDRPPLNLVFLIDTSGSMDEPNKLPLLVQSFRLMIGQLDPADEVAIVTYAGSAGRVLDATPATERGEILTALDRLFAAGSTAGAAGIQLAYRTAGEMAADGEVTRVILATDGDFNVGIADPEQLESFIARRRESGVYLSVLGFGRDNLDDATMQALAQAGNGQAAYVDTLAEAQKVLVDQLVGTLFPIANDVKIQVEFNPARVAEYRLIGYETRALRREDFSNDRVDAGEIGAGHSVTAIYEVTPVGSPAVMHEALRYAEPAVEPPARAAGARELAFLRLRYKEPGEDTSRLIELPIARDTGTVGSDQRFAAAIAGFGQLLRNGVYTRGWTWADVIALAEANLGDDRFGYRREALTLMRLARSLAEVEQP